MRISAAYDSSTGGVIYVLDALDECTQTKCDRLILNLERLSTFLQGRVNARSNVKFLEYLPAQDINGFTFGQIGKHVTISVLPVGGYGTSSGANMAKDMMHGLPTIQMALMICIGGHASC
jgi:hypothetical protein